MVETVYIEEEIKTHPRVLSILKHVNPKQIIECNHYKEVFNPKSQNFRLQKKEPALILANKKGYRVWPTPEGFGIGGEQNYYFSHMLNCLYDCRYCFLQGMYSSANYVLFINYEDFMDDIKKTIHQHPDQSAYFFSGYDCDSLAFEPMTGFLEAFLPFFQEHAQAILELRTKSTNHRQLLKQTPFPNCVVAYSFTPKLISEQVEHRVPLFKKRLKSLSEIANHGWKIGLRLDPLIYASNFEDLYKELIETLFEHISPKHVHSVSMGPMRFPEKYYQKITMLHPNDKLFAQPLDKRGKNYSYSSDIETKMKQFVSRELTKYLDQSLLFECYSS